jgi:CubicO group peptidase (beta-lactamase class C family)
VAEQPASVSPAITKGLLEQDLKFAGLVVTDAMRMRAVSTKYTSGEAAVRAIKAGIDLVLVPVDLDLAVDAIVKAVRNGEISEERIDFSVRKLLRTKQWAGLDRNRLVDLDKIGDIVGSREHRLAAEVMARQAVTVLGNKDNVLPFPRVDDRRILDLTLSDTDDPDVGNSLHELLRQRHPKMKRFLLDTRSNVMEYDSAMAQAKRSDVILLQLHFYTRSERMTGIIDSQKVSFMRSLSSLGKPVIAVSLGNPYVVMDIPRPDVYVCTYSNADCMQKAAAEVLFAEAPARGKLPIAIPGAYAFGEGVEYPQTLLRSGTPEEAGFDLHRLSIVDTIMQRAIEDSTFPGGVLLVARNGLVVYNKAYGGLDYDLDHGRSTIQTMYDLASVTKVIATTSAVMRLVDERKMRLEDPAVQYIPQFGQNGKERITLYNLMVHNSGLPAWRKFYEFCSTPQCVLDSVYATGLVYKTGDSTVYSDLGIITMGKVVEQITGVPLDRYVDSVFFKPLGMTNTMYNPPGYLVDRIAPTEVDTYWLKTGQAVRGCVHDENAAVLGGVSGHAGLFSTASDLAKFMQMLLNGGTYGGRRYIKEETVLKFVQRQSDQDSRAIGWDTKDPVRSWAGTLMSGRTFLHTGFTGTSVAADPEKNLIVILLSNRVYPSRSHTGISKVRPIIHDAIVRAMGN